MGNAAKSKWLQRTDICLSYFGVFNHELLKRSDLYSTQLKCDIEIEFYLSFVSGFRKRNRKSGTIPEPNFVSKIGTRGTCLKTTKVFTSL